jgi:hypothetical protein
MNEENIRKRIRILLEEIQNEADPVLLNRCRSIFRREVSFFRRSYMAAYLLLLAEGPVEKKAGSPNSPSGSRKEPDKNKERRGKPGRTDTEVSRVLSEEESARLFISIGRNRKVFPREILGLINTRANVARDDIGTIRILDNYSFIQVRNSAADAVIQALNGQSFRGRTLTVNYARSRQEGEEEQDDPSESEK